MNIQDRTEETKMLPQLIKQSPTYKLFVPKKVEEKIRYLIRKFPHTEWSGVLFYTHTGSFEDNNLEITCEDIYPMDLGTSGWTEFKMTPDVTAYIANNLELFTCETGLVHSHHVLGAFFSGQDTKTLNIEGNDTNCFVSLIVDTKGTYQAAITRKIKEKKEVTTYYFGKSYEFFGEGEVKVEPPYQAPDVHQKMIEEERIEYFMLDVTREEINNPLDYLDARFEEIEAKKKAAVPQRIYIPSKGDTMPIKNAPASPITDEEDKDFFDWLHSDRKTSAEAKEAILFDEETMEEMVDPNKWQPDPTIIHYLVCQLLTCSLIVNKDIDLKQWVTKHMEKKYDEIFSGADNAEFEGWSELYVDFIVNHYNDSDVPSDVYDDWDLYLGKIAKSIIAELEEFSSNGFIDEYISILNRYAKMIYE